MRLTAKSEYGLLALIDLAATTAKVRSALVRSPSGGPFRRASSSSSSSRLRRAGLVSAVRGAKGGFVLTRDPSRDHRARRRRGARGSARSQRLRQRPRGRVREERDLRRRAGVGRATSALQGRLRDHDARGTRGYTRHVRPARRRSRLGETDRHDHVLRLRSHHPGRRARARGDAAVLLGAASATRTRSTRLGRDAYRALEEARESVAEGIGAERPDEVIFTGGGTESRQRGAHRHPRQRGARRRRASDRLGVRAPRDPRAGRVAREARLRAHRAQAARGRPHPPGGPARRHEAQHQARLDHARQQRDRHDQRRSRSSPQVAHEGGALFHTDAAQTLGKIPFDVAGPRRRRGVVLGHKIYGPKGVGALYLKKRHAVRPPTSRAAARSSRSAPARRTRRCRRLRQGARDHARRAGRPRCARLTAPARPSSTA